MATVWQSFVLLSSWATLSWARQMPFSDYFAEKSGEASTVLSDDDDSGEVPSYVLQDDESNSPMGLADLDESGERPQSHVIGTGFEVDIVNGEVAELPAIIVPLRRELVPIRRQGKIVTYKTSYSGELSLGVPAQPFRAVFDTGSGHIIIPSVGCQSEACLIHKTYDLASSETGMAIHANGTAVKRGELTEEVTIGFGTGVVKSQFANDHVCLGPVLNETTDSSENNRSHLRRGCLEMRVLMAIEMSDKPFASFLFDGIVGLGLSNLAVSNEFSLFDMLSNSGQLAVAQFGFFLTEGENGEQSEISFGGPDPRRILDPIKWTPVIMADEGHWLVALKAVRINGELLDICLDGSCRAVVDTGTTHIGVPVKAKEHVHDTLMRDAGDYLDCRLTESYTFEFEFDSINLTLLPINYMRRMPLRDGVDVGNNNIVSDDLANAAGNITKNVTEVDVNATNVTRYCGPRVMATKFPPPLGPNLWILGEPLVQKYYTVYDWENLRVGFSVANSSRNTMPKPTGKGVLPEEVTAEGHLLCQNSLQP